MFTKFGSASSSQQRVVSMIDVEEEQQQQQPGVSGTTRDDNLSTAHRHSASMRPTSATRPKPLSTPSKPRPILHNLHPSAPTSPPTPAPSPTPNQRAPSWQSAGEDEDAFLCDARSHFSMLGSAERQRYLAELLNLCDNQLLSFVHHFVSPRLKKDPFETLPNELCLRVRKSKYICIFFLLS